MTKRRAKVTAKRGKAEKAARGPTPSGRNRWARDTFYHWVVHLTPKMAQELLDNRASNRPLIMSKALKWAEKITAGLWELNGETIKINKLGQLEDGQHRCQGIVIANRSVDVLVVGGLRPKIMTTVDRGALRTNAHMLARAGEKRYANLAGALSWLWRYGHHFNPPTNSPDWEDSEELLARHPKIRDSLPINDQAGPGPLLIPPTMVIALHYLMARADQAEADAFFRSLLTGENISANDPKTSAIYHLRRRLIQHQGGKTQVQHKEVWRSVVKAWQLTRGQGLVVRHFKLLDTDKGWPIIPGDDNGAPEGV